MVSNIPHDNFPTEGFPSQNPSQKRLVEGGITLGGHRYLYILSKENRDLSAVGDGTQIDRLRR